MKLKRRSKQLRKCNVSSLDTRGVKDRLSNLAFHPSPSSTTHRISPVLFFRPICYQLRFPFGCTIETCTRCGYMSSNALCKACTLLEGLERGMANAGIVSLISVPLLGLQAPCSLLNLYHLDATRTCRQIGERSSCACKMLQEKQVPPLIIYERYRSSNSNRHRQQ